MIMLSRCDQIGSGPFDSVAWAFEVHLKEPDTKEYNYGVLYGNEDAPDRIEFFNEEPKINSPPRKIWRREP